MTRAELDARKQQFAEVKAQEEALRKRVEEERANMSAFDVGVEGAKDFAGNLAYGFAETFMVPTVLDIASENIEGGINLPLIGQTEDLSKEFGSDDWIDESLAGKLGYALGTGAGLLTGIGAVGKGLSMASKLGKAGRAGAAMGIKKGADKGVKEIVDANAFRLVDTAREALTDGIKLHTKATKPLAFATRGQIKRNPLGNQQILQSASRTLRKSLKDMSVPDNQIAPLIELTLKETGESMGKNFGSSITSKLLKGPLQNSPRLAQLAGDMGYEAVLLGIFETAVGELGELTAEHMNMTEKDYPGLFKPWYSRVMHGAVMGSVLAPIRYIPGGKAVAFGKSGMVADIGHMGRMVKNRFRNVDKLSDAQLQMSLKTMLEASGGAPEFLANSVKEFTPGLLEAGMKLSIPQREILLKSMKAIRAKTPHFMKKMAAEIARDGAESFSRASVGSLAMNASAYKDQYEEMGTDAYPWDKVLVDHYIGMLYMKRGKVFNGKNKMKQFYDTMGENGTGIEVSKFVKSMDVLGYNPEKLAAINGYAIKSENKIINDLQNRMIEESSPALSKNNERVKENTIDVNETIERMNADPNLNMWHIHGLNEISNLDLRIQGEKDPVRKKALKAEREKLRDQFAVASELESDAILGLEGRSTRPMTAEESLVYIDKLASTEFNGEKLTALTAREAIRKEREVAVGSVTTRIRNESLNYITSSLEALGFKPNLDALGNPIIDPSVIRRIQYIGTNEYISRANGEKENPYIHAAKSLQETLHKAERFGFIKVSSGESTIRDAGTQISPEALKTFNDIYKASTEKMHQEFYADRTIEKSRWRDTMPLFSGAESGFPNPNIMSSTPVFEGMRTWEMHERNRTAYEIFSNKQGTGNNEAYQAIIGDLFQGKQRIFLEGDLTAKDGVLMQDVGMIVERMNRIKGILDPTGVVDYGRQGVEPSLITGKLNDALIEHLGTIAGKNILTNTEHYLNFIEYASREHMSNLLGNAEISSGLRGSLITALNPDNPTSRRMGDSIVLIEADKLLSILNTADGAQFTKVGKSSIIEANEVLVEQYKRLVEGPLKKAIAGGATNIQFSSKFEIDPTITSMNEVKQSIKEMTFKADINSVLDYQGLYAATGALSAEVVEVVKDMQSNVDLTKSNNDTLAESLSDLHKRASNVQDLINNLSRNNDAIGLRDMMDKSTDLTKLVNRMKQDQTTPEVIREYVDTLDAFLVDQFEKRQTKLDLETIKDLDNYIDIHLNNISTTDRSAGRKAGNTSISDTQYANTWFSGDMSVLENFKVNPIQMLSKLGVLSRRQQLLADYANEQLQKGESPLTFADLEKILPEVTSPKGYVDTFVAPMVESRRAMIEAQWITSPEAAKQRMGNSPADAYKNFVMDTFFILQSGLGQKKFPMAVFNNGVLETSEANISTWNRGINRLERRLGIEGLDQMFLAATKFGNERAFRTRLTPEMMKEIGNMSEGGIPVNIDPTRIINEGDRSHLERFGKYSLGTGKNGTGQFATITLDENTMIFVHQDAYKSIVDSWSRASSQNRVELLATLDPNAKLGGGSKAEKRINEYLERNLKTKVNADGSVDIAASVDNVKTLTLMTRLLTAAPHRMKDLIESNKLFSEATVALKYIKLDSPRTGVVLDKQGAEFTREYLDRMLPQNDILRQPYDTFLKQVFDTNGELKPQRTLTIRDEKGPGAQFFDTQQRGVEQLKQQLISEKGMSDIDASAQAYKIMESYKDIAASAANGAKYLSLPEMTAILMQKGARENWFIMEGGKVVGFNVAAKPIEHHAKVDPTTGEVTTYVGKTAYTYDPAVDAMMKRNGQYFVDSITFKSAVKENATWSQAENKYVEKIFETTEPGKSTDWISEISQDISSRVDNSHIYELPRESIFIKSISGIHDGTMSSAFGNFLTRDAHTALESVNGTKHSVNDMLGRYSQLQQSPLGMRKVADMLGGNAYEHGDNMMALVGIEGVLQAGGIPSFEFMAPQLEKMTTSEYLGRRNFTSSVMTNGAYSVMVPVTVGLSLPIRESGIQTRYGGSGITGHMGKKSISGLLGGGTEGVSLIFTLDKAFAEKHNLERGADYVVTFDGIVQGKGIEGNTKAKEALLASYKEVTDSARRSPGVENFEDFIMHIDGKVAEGDNSIKDNIVDNKSKNAQANVIDGGKSYKAIHAADVNLRTPMAGANDRVITKIEKVLNSKKGPVSEMNMLDVIDPQDADFDLDKSSSFFALPGKVIEEVVNLSGYMSPATDQFTKVLDEYTLNVEADMMNYRIAMLDLASKRSAVVRSHSVSSFLYQMASSIVPGAKVKSGAGSFEGSSNVKNSMEVFNYREANGQTVKVRFKGGAEYVNSIQFTKSLIKETIDIYKKSGKIDPQQIERMVYESTEGMFQIELQDAKALDVVDIINAGQLPVKSRQLFDTMIKEVLDPIARIFNIGNMTETMADGSKRKMSMWEINNAFQTAKRDIKQAGYNNKELFAFTDNLIGYLGEGYTQSKGKGVSHSPLIQGLIAIESGMRKHFKGNYEFNSTLADIMNAKTGINSDQITKAVEGVLSDQKRYAELEYAAWEVEQLQDRMASLAAHGQRGSKRYEQTKNMAENRRLLLDEANAAITAKEQDVQANVAKSSYVKKNTLMPIKVLRKDRNTGELVPLMNYKPGSTIFVEKGDVLIPNYKRLKIANENVSMQRRAMHKAFARQVDGVDRLDLKVVGSLVSEYKKALFKHGGDLVSDNPSSYNKFGIVSATQLGILGEYINKAGKLAPIGHSDAFIKQFIYSILAPKALGETFDIVGYDTARGRVQAQPSFEPNRNNERLVFTLLDKARSGKASTILESTHAEELYKTIVNEHKKAIMLEFDPSLRGDIFKFTSAERDPRDMAILPQRKELPQWVLDPNLDKTAKNILLSYMDGSYFMDPVELYRMTMKLYGNKLGEIPNPGAVQDVMNEIWNGSERVKYDPSGSWYKSRGTFDSLDGFQNKQYKSEGAENGLDKKHGLGKGC